MDVNIIKALKAIHAVTGERLYVDEVDGYYSLMIDKEPATGYLSGLMMYEFLCGLLAGSGVMELTSEKIRLLFDLAVKDGWVGKQAMNVAIEPGRALEMANLARRALMAGQESKKG